MLLMVGEPRSCRCYTRTVSREKSAAVCAVRRGRGAAAAKTCRQACVRALPTRYAQRCGSVRKKSAHAITRPPARYARSALMRTRRGGAASQEASIIACAVRRARKRECRPDFPAHASFASCSAITASDFKATQWRSPWMPQRGGECRRRCVWRAAAARGSVQAGGSDVQRLPLQETSTSLQRSREATPDAYRESRGACAKKGVAAVCAAQCR